jgi:hypothetical protein
LVAAARLRAAPLPLHQAAMMPMATSRVRRRLRRHQPRLALQLLPESRAHSQARRPRVVAAALAVALVVVAVAAQPQRAAPIRRSN